MGVYIKGMEMPQNCFDCLMSSFGLCNLIEGVPIGNPQKRLDNCLLVPIPPHGRLIDADALKSDGFCTIVCYTGAMPYEYTAMRIDDVPTIIEAEGRET